MSNHRYSLEESGDRYGQKFLDCEFCKQNLGERSRRGMQCGWEPEETRSGYPVAPWLGRCVGPEPTVCPGYSTSLPVVLEAARARRWAERGLLREYYSDQPLTPILFDAVDILDGEVDASHSDALKQIGKK